MLINITALVSDNSHSISLFVVDCSSHVDYPVDLHFVTSESITATPFSLFFVLLRNEQYFVKDLYLLLTLVNNLKIFILM